MPEITINQFLNFIESYEYDYNIFYELLSKTILYAKKLYISNFKQEEKEKNIIIIDSIINESFIKVIYCSLDHKDIHLYLQGLNNYLKE